jgi:hypothetical protein
MLAYFLALNMARNLKYVYDNLKIKRNITLYIDPFLREVVLNNSVAIYIVYKKSISYYAPFVLYFTNHSIRFTKLCSCTFYNFKKLEILLSLKS